MKDQESKNNYSPWYLSGAAIIFILLLLIAVYTSGVTSETVETIQKIKDKQKQGEPAPIQRAP